jgi:DNA polymerase-1
MPIPAACTPATTRPGAATGRLASNDPNLQNIPIRTDDGRRIRNAFVAPAGRKIVSCDYSQIELRIMAHLSQDAGLLRAFESGADIHRATAAEVFGKTLDEVSGNERRAGQGDQLRPDVRHERVRPGAQLGIAAARRRITSRCTSRAIPACATSWSARASRRASGLRRNRVRPPPVPGQHHARNAGLRAGAERAAINAPMQGTAADIIKRAMIDDRRLAAPQGARADAAAGPRRTGVRSREPFVETSSPVRVAHGRGRELRVPLVVDAGTGLNWDEAH